MPKPVLVDTNVWVSALINPHGYPAKLKDAWLNNKFHVIVSIPLLKEIAEVLHRPRIKNKYQITDAHIERFLTLLSQKAIHVEVSGNFRICRDPDDDIILETALLGKAKYMVSRDDDIKSDADLIAKMQDKGITVYTVSHFLKELSNW